MRRIVLILPGLLVEPDSESPLRQKLPALQVMAETGSVFRLAAMPRIETPEALFLGMRPNEAQMRQGPLTVSALGADPPEKSTHFHLSLMSFVDGVVDAPDYLPTPTEVESISEQAKRLNTSKLTLVRGEALDHGLVWESRGDFGTTSATDVKGQPMKPNLPEGDGETLFRRYIDDSINLLTDLELNQRRIDEGLAPLNLLWPWGHGERRPVPNLLLRRGERAVVESGSMRLAGLSRLAGYRHEDRALVGRGVNTKFRNLAQRTGQRDVSIIFLDAFEEFNRAGKEEELHWMVRELDREMLQPLFDSALETATRITLLSPGLDGKPGLGLVSEPQSPLSNWVPFDERSLEERLIPTRDVATEVESGVTL
ncbi:hypothetical protein [Fimbriimonas ginsengisoli]|uniref:2,3-bisphosphoglycerate-independent phosphoglycerate mutase n=1 Tax=Fimbriimonas ginsengisoli Gsoil 348 TaxID=661478 RepID=A0A068NZ62_FIMGI|nr:hypothetical protein [Fimbriimonas ginsengisoli]AIE88019.1 2,3-bisphosphoglycerate-independent phosphoglycerate mutase [Fimbriimonas ginsengisoli Gsoil 348]